MVISGEQMVALRFIFGMMEPKVVILMFASGKLVCTGAKTEREVYEAVYKLKKILEENQLITYVSHRIRRD